MGWCSGRLDTVLFGELPLLATVRCQLLDSMKLAKVGGAVLVAGLDD